MMGRARRFLRLAACCAALAGCLTEDRLGRGGNASETTNQIAGLIVDERGAPAARVEVRLVPEGFDPIADTLAPGLRDTTGPDGAYAIRPPVSGAYRLEADGPARAAMAACAAFHYSGGRLGLAPLRLRCPGRVEAALPDSLRASGGRLYVPGTTYWAYVGERRRAALGPLPPMRIPVLAYARDAGSPRLGLARDLEIPAGGTVEVTVASAVPRDSARIWAFGLDTRASGAGVPEDVAGFPILVRLDSAFDFAAVREPGLRLSASKPDGTPLPLGIERWDSLSRRAELWIRMDTVRGDADTQAILIRYQPADGPRPAVDSAGPFDAADGFAGVWHLEGAPGDRIDATGNGHWARPVRFRGDETAEGRVGEAVHLSGSSHLEVGVVDVAGPITVSAWVLPDGTDYSAPLVGKPSPTEPALSHFAYALMQDGINLNRNLGAGFGVSDGNAYPQAESDPGHAGWTYLCGTYDGGTVRLYRDGAWVAANAQSLPAGLERNGLATLIGAYTPDSAYAAFRGSIDEVRIETRARSAAWIRLAFENQKEGQTLVRPKARP